MIRGLIKKHIGYFENRTAKNWDAEILLKDILTEYRDSIIKQVDEMIDMRMKTRNTYYQDDYRDALTGLKTKLLETKMKKYKLAKDLPFAKVGDGHKLFVSENDGCKLIDKDGFGHTLEFGDELFTHGIDRLISEGWIEEVKPREWYIHEHKSGIWQVFDTKELARLNNWGKMEDNNIIKVREVENE